jgi:3-oxoacyl-[acyl-carrier protein] reductase
MGGVSLEGRFQRMIVATGASGGVGQALLPHLLSFDDVVGLYSRFQDLPDHGSRLRYERVQLDSEEAIGDLVDRMREDLSRITLVHFAAQSIDRLAMQLDVKDWDRVLRVNLTGDFLLTKALLPLMVQEKWGRIIHVSSVVGERGKPGTAAYSAAKSGLRGLSRVLAKEYARYNITSNVLILGYLNVGLIDTLDETAREEALEQIPSGKFGDVSSVGHAVDFLIKSDYVNGAEIHVDGGI